MRIYISARSIYRLSILYINGYLTRIDSKLACIVGNNKVGIGAFHFCRICPRIDGISAGVKFCAFIAKYIDRSQSYRLSASILPLRQFYVGSVSSRIVIPLIIFKYPSDFNCFGSNLVSIRVGRVNKRYIVYSFRPRFILFYTYRIISCIGLIDCGIKITVAVIFQNYKSQNILEIIFCLLKCCGVKDIGRGAVKHLCKHSVRIQKVRIKSLFKAFYLDADIRRIDFYGKFAVFIYVIICRYSKIDLLRFVSHIRKFQSVAHSVPSKHVIFRSFYITQLHRCGISRAFQRDLGARRQSGNRIWSIAFISHLHRRGHIGR